MADVEVWRVRLKVILENGKEWRHHIDVPVELFPLRESARLKARRTLKAILPKTRVYLRGERKVKVGAWPPGMARERKSGHVRK